MRKVKVGLNGLIDRLSGIRRYDARMRILVIGGTAFMGPEIVRRLVARGHDVSSSASARAT